MATHRTIYSKRGTGCVIQHAGDRSKEWHQKMDKLQCILRQKNVAGLVSIPPWYVFAPDTAFGFIGFAIQIVGLIWLLCICRALKKVRV